MKVQRGKVEAPIGSGSRATLNQHARTRRAGRQMHSRRYIGAVHHHPPSRCLKNTANLASLERRVGTCAKYRAVMPTYSVRDNAKGNTRARPGPEDKE